MPISHRIGSRTAATTPSRRVLALLVTLGVSIAVTACGSDDSSSDGAGTDVTIGADDPAVGAFCNGTEALIGQIGTIATAGGDLSTLTGAVDAINTSGAALVSATPAAATAVSACMQAVSAALTSAATGIAPAGPTTVAGDTPETPTTIAGDTTSANPDVQVFCAGADELAAELAQMMADPASANAAELAAKVTELTNSATTLMTANPADVPAITECLQRISAALTPGAPGGPGAPSTTVAATPGGDASGDVEAFCTSAEELGQQLKDAMANPAGADVAAITAQATELSNQAQALIAASPEAAARISECLSKLNPT